MSFYITLPSNSPSILNNNTQSSYTTLLNKPLHLKGPYEVALSDINFTKNFKVNLGSFKILNKLEDRIIQVCVEVENGISVFKFCKIVNEKIIFSIYKHYCEKNNIQVLNYFDFKKEKCYTEMLKKEKNNFPYFENISNTIIIDPKNNDIIEFEGFIKNVMFQGRELNILTGSSYIFYMPDNINIINYIIVYTDIIESQFYGDRMSKILRSLPIKTSQNGELSTVFDNNHYVNVGSTYINSINIEIRDIFGNLIRFDDFFSYVIVNLHLRPKFKENGLE